jgi:hypothetical protein
LAAIFRREPILLSLQQAIEIIAIIDIVSSGMMQRNKSPRDETIFCFRRRHPETADGYRSDNNNGGQRRL